MTTRAHDLRATFTHGWEVAMRDAYPSVVVVAGDGLRRPASAHALDVLEAIAQGDYSVLAIPLEATNDAEDWQDGDLLARFEGSPEARALETHDGWPSLLLELARNECGASATALSADIVDEVVFEIFPRDVGCDASAASAIITELRAFFTYVGRELAFENAEECLAAIGEGAEEDLHAALSDFSSFGSEKLSAAADAEEASEAAAM